MNYSDQSRIAQLTSPYSPFSPPQLPLDFSDYLSLLWRIDRHASHNNLVRYYSQCTYALSRAFGFEGRGVARMIKTAEPGQVYAGLSNAPFRNTERLGDAAARKAAIQQLVMLRADVLSVGAYQHDWMVGWPGSGVIDSELRERVYATLFTALRSQYSHFGRLLLVIDIVLQELLFGSRDLREFSLGMLIDHYGYPDPESPHVRHLYNSESGAGQG
ncbi:MAG: hypothetical protein JXJ20_06465 [Anaerolineae bacterium]|jgi:hypothetical protein|nr:hypothetical protein [Anaerolineae bacterium]